ncbi:hypothetical protein U1Q18_050909 [Sarracenia purpurea var. burkii]
MQQQATADSSSIPTYTHTYEYIYENALVSKSFSYSNCRFSTLYHIISRNCFSESEKEISSPKRREISITAFNVPVPNGMRS